MFKNTMEKEQEGKLNVAINSPNIIGSLNHVTKDIHYQGKGTNQCWTILKFSLGSQHGFQPSSHSDNLLT